MTLSLKVEPCQDVSANCNRCDLVLLNLAQREVLAFMQGVIFDKNLYKIHFVDSF
jgi:hypothetical protein